MQMLIQLWCHTDGIVQILVVDIREYIDAHDIGDSRYKDIYTELDTPKAATAESTIMISNVVKLVQISAEVNSPILHPL